MLSDLKIAKTAAGVIGAQSLEGEDWLRFAVGLLLLILYNIGITFVYKRKELASKLLYKLRNVGLLFIVWVLIFCGGRALYKHVLLYNGHIKYGFIGNFYITLNSNLDIPDNASEYVIEDKNDEGDYNPNVIVIMNEAFSDLGETFDLSINQDPLAYFHSLQEQYPNGITYSSVKGNNTCSSEWEVLSVSPTALTAKGAMIYQNINNSVRSLVDIFNSRGYTTVALHPYYGFGYNRRNMYQNLGFDITLFLEEMPTNLSTIRGFVTDDENYKQIIDAYENNERNSEAPFFCFNITMQNHGGYKTGENDSVHLVDNNEYEDVNAYLSVLKHSDDALKKLISYFESIEEDTIILFFGDHQPMINNTFTRIILEKRMKNFR